MAKAKPKPTSPITGRWRIISMSAREDEYLDEEVEAFFQFGYVQGLMDWRTTNREAGRASKTAGAHRRRVIVSALAPPRASREVFTLDSVLEEVQRWRADGLSRFERQGQTLPAS
jgi:hypothetical protein